MQKLDYVENLEIIVNELESKHIVRIYKMGFNKPDVTYNFSTISPLLFKTKSNLDRICIDDNINIIMKNLDGLKYFNVEVLAKISEGLKNTSAQYIFKNNLIMDFYLFHRALIMAYETSKSSLINDDFANGYKDKDKEGINVFQILINKEGLSVETYIKILKSLNDLASILSKIFKEEEIEQKVILLDSGSDTNLGIKTGVETAKTLFLIFKEIWDFIVNKDFYQEQRINDAIIKSLTIRSIIKEKEKKEIISKAESKEFIELIQRNTNKLIGLKTFPKEIVKENRLVINKEILSHLNTPSILLEKNEKEDNT